MPRKAIPLFIVVTCLLSLGSCTCIYFNTFHNIRKSYSAAEKTRKQSGRENATGTEIKQYNDAVTKASRVLERHPTSSWVDDALFIIGSSYYHLGDFDKSNRKFKELFANYPHSEYLSPARLLYAKVKLNLKEEAEALVLFEEILANERDKSMRGDAARSLGQYYFDSKDYAKATVYFQALVDSLGQDSDKLRAMTYVADGYYDLYQFDKAYRSYESALKHNPDSLQTYRITYRLAQCDYFLNRIPEGLAKLGSLAGNQTYLDSLGSLRLMMAQGYEWDGDMEGAINTYQKIIEENPKKKPAAIAYYQLGLIYQYDLEDLARARTYYTKARDELAGSPIYADATKRASTLAMLEQFSGSDTTTVAADSTGATKQKDIDQAARNLFQLGELFYVDLEKPDSAVHAFEALLEKYPTSRYGPRTLIALAHIYRTDYSDTAAADSLFRQVLVSYPRADEAEEVINTLGLVGTVADTGYAAHVFRQAEDFFEQFRTLDSSRFYLRLAADSGADRVQEIKGRGYRDTLGLLDSARHYYRLTADSFPNSDYSIQARYVLLTIYDSYLTPGDSTLADQYAAFADSFPGTIYAAAVDKLLTMPVGGKSQTGQPSIPNDTAAADSLGNIAAADSLAADSSATRPDTLGGLSRLISDVNGKQLPPALEYFDREVVAFVYPMEAVGLNIESKLYFHIRIDFNGEVVEVKLMNPTQSDELNRRATETVKNTKFLSGRIPPELYDHWFYYTYTVTIPQEYRQ